jgi:hypothetical protein
LVQELDGFFAQITSLSQDASVREAIAHYDDFTRYLGNDKFEVCLQQARM